MPGTTVNTTSTTQGQRPYLGAPEVDIIDESHAITRLGHLVSYTQVREANGILFRRGSFSVRAHDEVYGVERQILPIRLAVEALEPVAVRWLVVAKARRVGQVLNEHSSCEAILVRLLLGYATWNAQMLVHVEPEHMKVAATFRQLAEEGLDGVHGVQQLEAV